MIWFCKIRRAAASAVWRAGPKGRQTGWPSQGDWQFTVPRTSPAYHQAAQAATSRRDQPSSGFSGRHAVRLTYTYFCRSCEQAGKSIKLHNPPALNRQAIKRLFRPPCQDLTRFRRYIFPPVLPQSPRRQQPSPPGAGSSP